MSPPVHARLSFKMSAAVTTWTRAVPIRRLRKRDSGDKKVNCFGFTLVFLIFDVGNTRFCGQSTFSGSGYRLPKMYVRVPDGF
jgi:hypothetical protein